MNNPYIRDIVKCIVILITIFAVQRIAISQNISGDTLYYWGFVVGAMSCAYLGVLSSLVLNVMLMVVLLFAPVETFGKFVGNLGKTSTIRADKYRK